MSALEWAKARYQRFFKAGATLRDHDQFSAYREGVGFDNLFKLYDRLKIIQKGPCSITVPLQFYPSELGINEKKEQITIPIEGVVNSKPEGDTIDFNIGDRTVTDVPRNTSGNPDGLVGVSTSKRDQSIVSINLEVFPEQKDLYYGGLVWINTGPKPTISFVINHDHGKVSTAKLVKNHMKAYSEAVKTIQKILDFQPSN